jgi:small subunit ribosomal protein S4e
MKRQTAPSTWKINRKGTKFVVRPNPGKSFKLSMPLSLIFKNILKICKTTKEVKSILQDKEVLVNGTRRKDHRFPVGIMDVISLPVSNENFRVLLNKKGKLVLIKIDKENAKLLLGKILGKKKLRKGLIQINFFEGRNYLLKKKSTYKIGDTLVFQIPDQKIMDHIEFNKNNMVLLTGGKHIGEYGTIQRIEKGMIEIKNSSGNKILTSKEHAFLIGKDKPLIKLND